MEDEVRKKKKKKALLAEQEERERKRKMKKRLLKESRDAGGGGGGGLLKKRKKLPSPSSSSGGGSSSLRSASGGKPSKKTKPSSSSSSSSSAAAASAAPNHDQDEDTWEGCWEADRRLAAVTKGLAWVMKRLAAAAAASGGSGSGRVDDGGGEGEGGSEGDDAAAESVVPAVYALVRLTPEPVRQEVLERLQPHLERWKHACLQPPRSSSSSSSSSSSLSSTGSRRPQGELIRAVRRIVRLERLGVYAQEREKVDLAGTYVSVDGAKKASSNSRRPGPVWSIGTYLGWNPLAGPPPAEGAPDPFDPAGPRLSQRRLMARSLEWMLLLELSGLVRGQGGGDGGGAKEEGEREEGEEEEIAGLRCPELSAEGRLAHVLKWLPAFRPYLGPEQCADPEDYRDQALLAASVVMALSRGGELRIPALLLPHEYFFLREHLPVHLLKRDAFLVGRSLDALRVLGGHDENPVFRAGMGFLLAAQRSEDGGWARSLLPLPTAAGTPPRAASGGAPRYAPTMAAVRALLVREFRGFGPLPQETLQLLLAWQKADADPASSSSSSDPSSSASPALLILPDGSPDPRAAGMAKAVARIKAQAKEERQRRKKEAAAAAAAPASAAPVPAAPAPVPAALAPVAAGAVGAGGGMVGEMEKRVARLMEAVARAEAEARWADVLAGLQAIEREPMTVAGLHATGAGRLAGRLKKAGDDAVAALSKRLVKRWKALVMEEGGSGNGGGGATA